MTSLHTESIALNPIDGYFGSYYPPCAPDSLLNRCARPTVHAEQDWQHDIVRDLVDLETFNVIDASISHGTLIDLEALGD